MAVRFRNGRYQVEFQLAGERVFRRLPIGEDKAAAKALESKLRHEIFQRRTLGRTEEPLLAAVIEAWLRATEHGRKDRRNPRQNATHLADFVGGKVLRQVADAAREAVTSFTRAGDALAPSSAANSGALSAATINRRLDVLRASARWAWKQGIATENYGVRVPRLREENARQVYLTAKEVRLLASCAESPTCKAAIMLAAYSGLRASELLRLSQQSISAGTLLVHGTKTGRPRSVPVAGPARAYLSALPLGLSYRQLVGQFWLARKAAGMPHVRFHDLRHSCASMLINAGVDLFVVGKILGHSSPATTARYSHLSDASVKAAMRKLR